MTATLTTNPFVARELIARIELRRWQQAARAQRKKERAAKRTPRTTAHRGIPLTWWEHDL